MQEAANGSRMEAGVSQANMEIVVASSVQRGTVLTVLDIVNRTMAAQPRIFIVHPDAGGDPCLIPV